MRSVFMLSLAGFSMVYDIWKGKIPNPLIMAGLGIGWCFQLTAAGALGILDFLGGAGLPLFLLAGLYYFRMIGAGDVKLLAMLGGFMGVTGSFYCMLMSLLTGGAVSVGIVLWRRNLWSRLRYFMYYCRAYLDTGKWVSYREGDQGGGQFYFSIPVFISVVLYVGGMY